MRQQLAGSACSHRRTAAGSGAGCCWLQPQPSIALIHAPSQPAGSSAGGRSGCAHPRLLFALTLLAGWACFTLHVASWLQFINPHILSSLAKASDSGASL